MQASQARWAVVAFCMLGSLGCQGTKSWWPGQKPLAYSQSSPNPPAVQQAQQGHQTQPYSQAPAYTDQASYGQTQGAAVAPAGYPTNGYPIGNANAQDPYGMAGQAGAGAYPGYPQGQQQLQGAYPEQYSNTANPYAQPGAGMGGYADSQANYAGNAGYQQTGANSVPGAGGYSARTADARAGGYSTNSPYDATGGAGAADPGQYNGAAGAGGPPVAGDPYQPGQTGYQPGQTGYNPQGVAPYQPPAPYHSDPNATGAGDAPYRPGSTKDYAPSGAAATGDYGQPPAGAAPAGYGNTSAYPTGPAAGGYGSASPYPSTSAGTGSYGAPPAYPSTAAPAVDRYGRPIQQASGGYSDPTLQR